MTRHPLLTLLLATLPLTACTAALTGPEADLHAIATPDPVPHAVRPAPHPAPGPTPGTGRWRAWVPRQVQPTGDVTEGHWLELQPGAASRRRAGAGDPHAPCPQDPRGWQASGRATDPCPGPGAPRADADARPAEWSGPARRPGATPRGACALPADAPGRTLACHPSPARRMKMSPRLRRSCRTGCCSTPRRGWSSSPPHAGGVPISRWGVPGPSRPGTSRCVRRRSAWTSPVGMRACCGVCPWGPRSRP